MISEFKTATTTDCSKTMKTVNRFKSITENIVKLLKKCGNEILLVLYDAFIEPAITYTYNID